MYFTLLHDNMHLARKVELLEDIQFIVRHAGTVMPPNPENITGEGVERSMLELQTQMAEARQRWVGAGEWCIGSERITVHLCICTGNGKVFLVTGTLKSNLLLVPFFFSVLDSCIFSLPRKKKTFTNGKYIRIASTRIRWRNTVASSRPHVPVCAAANPPRRSFEENIGVLVSGSTLGGCYITPYLPVQ